VFAGDQTDVPALTAALDLAALPSIREAQGIALLEAMASGVPVVASAVGGIPETVRDDREGLLVPPVDPAALSTAIVRLARDESTRARLAASGRRRVEDRFGLDGSVRQITTVYEQALSEAPEVASAVGR
jgi:2-deoxystreptamine N-acetyl-D-glucosaminyltransferase/2-deoxystreptamine glucosyltransferase